MKRRKKETPSNDRDPQRQPQKGRRFTLEQKEHALMLVASGMKRVQIASVIGTTVESIRRWVKEAEQARKMPTVPRPVARDGHVGEPDAGDATSSEDVSTEASAAETSDGRRDSLRSPYAPKDPGHGLSDIEVAAILELKKRHPSMGPAQIRAQLKRFKGWRIAVRAVNRVLRAAGYESVHREARPQGPDPIRFEAPRPNALWQADFAELRVGVEKFYILIVLDDFSRFVVGHGLCDSPSAEAAITILRCAIARHGRPEALRTDRGGAFLAADFAQFLESELIDPIVGRAYHPQGGGKVEAAVKTLRRELWDVEHFDSRDEAAAKVDNFFAHYNGRRAHMGIDGLTPADRYFGRAEEVLSLIDGISRRRQASCEQFRFAGGPIEELLDNGASAPLEVLRLMINDGVMELRFCGVRVRLGRLER